MCVIFFTHGKATVIKFMEYNEQNETFSEGIAPGGLREKSELKLLLCYLLKMVDKSLTRSQINDIFQEYPVANYFEVNEALSELVKNGSVVSDITEGDEVFTITHKAKFEVSTIERSLPRSIREKTVSAALGVLTRDKIKSECEVTTEQRDGGYYVTFSVNDVGVNLMSLTLFVADASQVEIVKKNFFSNAVSIYSNILSSLTVE